MKTFTFLFEILTIASFLTSCKVATELQPSDEADISEFVGQWIIHVADGGISWMDVRQEEGYLDADLLWKEGSVDPVSDVYLVKNEYLVVTRTYETVLQRDENNNPVRSRMITRWLEIKSDGEDISGYYLQPRRNGTGIDSLAFTGNRMPPVPEAPNLSNLNYGEPVTLFNGTGLSGWIPTDTGLVNGFTVIDGIMVNDVAQKENGPVVNYGNIRTEQEFEDFNLTFEVNIPEGSNSGVYLRGMYEVQVYDSYQKPLGKRNNMGAIYGRITPSVNAEKPSGTWQTMDVTLCDRHVTVILNGVKIIDNKPLYGPTGEAIRSDVLAPGPIYIQGNRGKVSYRNMILTPIIKN